MSYYFITFILKQKDPEGSMGDTEESLGNDPQVSPAHAGVSSGYFTTVYEIVPPLFPVTTQPSLSA